MSVRYHYLINIQGFNLANRCDPCLSRENSTCFTGLCIQEEESIICFILTHSPTPTIPRPQPLRAHQPLRLGCVLCNHGLPLHQPQEYLRVPHQLCPREQHRQDAVLCAGWVLLCAGWALLSLGGLSCTLCSLALSWLQAFEGASAWLQAHVMIHETVGYNVTRCDVLRCCITVLHRNYDESSSQHASSNLAPAQYLHLSIVPYPSSRCNMIGRPIPSLAFPLILPSPFPTLSHTPSVFALRSLCVCLPPHEPLRLRHLQRRWCRQLHLPLRSGVQSGHTGRRHHHLRAR